MGQKLSDPMTRILRNLNAGDPATFGFPGGRSQSGGLGGTFLALRRRGLLDSRDQITPAGREAVAPAAQRASKEGRDV